MTDFLVNSFKNLANYTSGMTMIFFVFIDILLYQKRAQSRFVRFLYWITLFWTVLFLKDIIYLIDNLWGNSRINHITMSIDTLSIPVFSAFFFEIVKPGWINTVKVFFMSLPTLVLAIIVIATDSTDIFRGLIIYSNIFAVVVAVLILYSVRRFNKYIKMNYSYTETINIYWLRRVVFLLLMLLFVSSALACTDARLGESAYYLSLIAVFSYIYLNTMRHHIVPIPKGTLNPFAHHTDDDEGVQATTAEIARFAAKLTQTMEEQHIFLNPLLTLREVATIIGTNRTYLSEYLNRELKTNFYDYINVYRVKEAEKLLLSDKNIKLGEVSERCGFNSLSTFQRYFAKINGMTPTKFRTGNTPKQ